MSKENDTRQKDEKGSEISSEAHDERYKGYLSQAEDRIDYQDVDISQLVENGRTGQEQMEHMGIRESEIHQDSNNVFTQ